jgi:DNA repair exonuclease SbcCD nuclease subunit
MFAYCDNATELKARIKEAVRERAEMEVPEAYGVGLFHHGFKGARVGSSLEYEVKEPIDAAKLKLTSYFDFVWSGHYHSHQAIEGCDGAGWYIGSPLEHTRSDTSIGPVEKGFVEMTIHPGEREPQQWRVVPLNRPRFIKLLPTEDVVDEQLKGNFVDVYYEEADGRHEERLAMVRLAGARGVTSVALPRERKVEKRLDVSPELDPAKVVSRYVKHKTKDDEDLDRRALVRIGRDLIRDAEQEE